MFLRTQCLKILLFQIVIILHLSLFILWNSIVPIKKTFFSLLQGIPLNNELYKIKLCPYYYFNRCLQQLSLLFFFFISIFEVKELWIFRDNVREIVRPRLQGKRFFCSLWGVTRRTERKNFSLSRLFKPGRYQRDSNSLSLSVSLRSYRTTNVSTFWNASLWQSSSYQNEIIIQPEAIKWNRSKNNHFVMQFFLLFRYIYIFRFKKKKIIYYIFF